MQDFEKFKVGLSVKKKCMKIQFSFAGLSERVPFSIMALLWIQFNSKSFIVPQHNYNIQQLMSTLMLFR